MHCTCPLSGVKRTWAGAVQMSAFDPKRTWQASGGEFINLRRSGAELREIRLILRASRRFAGGAAGADHMDGKASRERRELAPGVVMAVN